MGVETRTIRNVARRNVESVGDSITGWMMNSHNFALSQKTTLDNKCVIVMKKANLARQLSGLAFEYKMEITEIDSHLVVSVDNGDIRQQVVALGLAWFVTWPLIVTAGYGMYSSHTFRSEILNKIEAIACA